MAKPSIFSKEYEKKMKKRRRIKIISICSTIIVVIITIGIVKYKSSFKMNFSSLTKIFNTKQKIKDPKSTSKDRNKHTKVTNEAKELSQDTNKEKSYVVKLDELREVKALYDEVDNKKIFKGIKSIDDKVSFDIAPSKQGMLVYDGVNQNFFYIDINGNQKDVTNHEYISTSGESFSKESHLKENPTYIWGAMPKFIDDNSIAYLSQLPWFKNDGVKYIWVKNLTSGENIYIQNIAGTNIKFDKVTAKGLTVNMDGNTYYLSPNGFVQ